MHPLNTVQHELHIIDLNEMNWWLQQVPLETAKWNILFMFTRTPPQILVTSAPYLFSVFNSAREAADVTLRRRRSMNRIVVSRHVIVMTFHTRLRHTDTFGSAMHVSNCFCEHTDIE